MPFAHAVRELAAFTHVHVHASTARRTTEAAGATLVALQTQDAAHILATAPAGPPAAAAAMVVSVDGAMVPLLHGQWGEVRTLAVGTPVEGTDAKGAPIVTTTQVSYFSRLTSSATFADLATVELHQRGVFAAPQVAGIVDGAEWCQTFLDLHLPTAVRILDFPHAAEYVCALGATAGPDGRLVAVADVDRMLHSLKHAGPTLVLEDLRPVVAAASDPAAAEKLLAYLEKRTDQLAYPAFQAAGWPIGSGMVESANKVVVEQRLKGAGMHWASAHVNPMLAFRNAVANDRWVAQWTAIEQEQRHQARAARAKRCHPAVEPRLPTVVPSAESGSARRLPAEVLAQVQAELAQEKAVHPWKRAFSVRRQCERADTA